MNDIDELIDEIEIFTIMIWKNSIFEFFEKFPELVSLIMKTLPSVITLYSNESMIDISSDALYWPEQVNKIVTLVDNKNDFIAIADALYFELRANLIEFREIVLDRKVV